MATEIVVAYLGGRTVEPAELPALVLSVRSALTREVPSPDSVVAASPQAPAEATPAARPVPAVPIGDSITPDYLISLEDGRRLKSLKRHLRAKYNLSPEEYRRKWGLPDEYPMVAPNYAERRSKLARQIGLGGRAGGKSGRDSKLTSQD